MYMSMQHSNKCSKCGAKLATDLPNKLCGRCLFRLALESQSEAPQPDPVVHELSSADSLSDGIIVKYFGNYELIQVLSSGGMGVVYKARQMRLNRIVAVKMLLPNLVDNEERLARFRIEAQAVASLLHPNIVAIHEVGEHGRYHYFSMDYVPGGDLAKRTKGRPLEPSVAATYVRKIADAVHHAHQRGILHRDLKPGNVLVDENDEPQVTDFGIAKLLNAPGDLTHSGQLMGTPGFMSPEQVDPRRGEATIASDVYSLGAILYYLLCGRAPFKGETIPATLLSILNESPVPIHELHPSVPRDLETIALRCLQKEPGKRYLHAREVAAELERYLRHEPIKARPVSTLERFHLWYRREPTLAILSGVTACLVLAIGIGSRMAIDRINRERGEQSKERDKATKALNQNSLDAIESMFSSGDSDSAIAQLASLLRREPSNRVAAERLQFALTQRNFAPEFEELRIPLMNLSAARFSSDDMFALTVEAGNRLKIWDLKTRRQMHETITDSCLVTCVDFSPDNRLVAIGVGFYAPNGKSATRREVNLLDVTTGKRVAGPINKGRDTISVSFSRDGKQIATISEEGARVWDVQTGQAISGNLAEGRVLTVATLSPNGARLLTGSMDGNARIWDTVSGKPLTPPLPHPAPVSVAEFSSDGLRILTASSHRLQRGLGRFLDTRTEGTTKRLSSEVKLWNAETGQLISESLHHNAGIYCAHFSPDGELVVSASLDQTVRVWDGRTGEAITDVMHHREAIISAEFSPNGQWIVTASQDRTARLWEARTGLPVAEPIRHEGPLAGFHFLSDNRSLCTADMLLGLRTWEIRTAKELNAILWHDSFITATSVSPDGKRVVTSSYDCIVRVWDSQQGTQVMHPINLGSTVRDARFTMDGSKIATVDQSSARLFDAITGKELNNIPLPLNPQQSVRWNAQGNRLIIVSQDGQALIWDIHTGKKMTLPESNFTSLLSAEFSPDGLWAITISVDKLQLWDAMTGSPMKLQWNDVVGRAYSPEFSPDSTQILIPCSDRTARIWELRTGKQVVVLKHEDMVYSAHFSADGKKVITASQNGVAKIWDSASGRTLTPPLKHSAALSLAVFSPDGIRAVTGSEDKTVRFWDAETGHPLTDPYKLESTASSAVFSPNSQRLITWGGAKARIWEIPACPLPVPDWVPRFGEAVVKTRLLSDGTTQKVTESELLSLKKEIDKSTPSGLWKRWADWIMAPPTARSISPFSELTVEDCFHQHVDQGSLESLTEAAKLSATNTTMTTTFVRAILALEASERDQLISNAIEYALRGIKLAPEHALSWRTVAEVLEQMGQLSDAIAALDNAISLEPNNPELWNSKARLLEKTDRESEAETCYEKAIDLLRDTTGRRRLSRNGEK